MQKHGIIKFNHPLREKWDILIIVLTIYNCIELPFDAAFNYRSNHDPHGITDIINGLIDLMNMLDIVLNFRTTFLNKITGQEIIIPKEIVRNYLQGQFLIDLIASIPFDFVYESFFKSGGDDSTNL